VFYGCLIAEKVAILHYKPQCGL